MNNIINEDEEEEKKDEDSVYEAINTTTRNKDKDKDNDNGGGYELWTKKDWCWLLPFPPAVVDEIESRSSTTTRRQENDDGKNSGSKDYNTANDDDDDESSAKSKMRRKNTVERYRKWQNERWDKIFQILVAYKNQRDSTNVPKEYELDSKHARWVTTQRNLCKNQEISVERTRCLDCIGIVWKIVDIVLHGLKCIRDLLRTRSSIILQMFRGSIKKIQNQQSGFIIIWIFTENYLYRSYHST